MIRRIRLGYVVGAFFFAFPVVMRGQVVVPPASEVPIPPKPSDSTAKPKPDSLKAPFGRSVIPRTADIGPQYQWNREELFASGAYTVADLLERVPGATSFRTGWLASPKFVAMNGDLGKIKVFYDGIELDNLDPRSGSMLDLTTIDLWALENVSIERFANELRVHLRSWRVDNTDPVTRTDVYTGDEDTNIYRGFYGKRFNSGAGLQVAGQQFSTRSARFGGGGDALSFMGRAGIAKRMWSVDAYAVRRNASRVIQPNLGDGLSLPPFQGTQTIAYLRTAIGNQTGGPWLEALASNMRLAESSAHQDQGAALTKNIRADTTDTTTKRIQYSLTGGIARGPIHASVTDRIRAFEGDVTHSQSARFEATGKIGVFGLYGEKTGDTKRKRVDAVFRVTPLSFLAIAGAASYDSPDKTSEPEIMFPDITDSTVSELVLPVPKTKSARIEVGIRLWSPWLIAGFITRDTAVLAPPTVIDSAYSFREIGKRNGLYAGLRGKLYKDINLEVLGTKWDSAGFYQPKYQARSEINLSTRWLSRFPKGSFGLKFAVIHEYRSEVKFPIADGFRTTSSAQIMSALLEIRILKGVASYQVRNMWGEIYQIMPGFIMPRSVGVYGIRWEFWN
jgi:hypothetical protein